MECIKVIYENASNITSDSHVMSHNVNTITALPLEQTGDICGSRSGCDSDLCCCCCSLTVVTEVRVMSAAASRRLRRRMALDCLLRPKLAAPWASAWPTAAAQRVCTKWKQQKVLCLSEESFIFSRCCYCCCWLASHNSSVSRD